MTDRKTWGALPKEWAWFLNIGLAGDLLPVVCNPEAPIGELSKMRKVGKTPSLYNKDGFAVGMSKWTEKESTKEQIARWRKEPDYGICIQTRLVRAFDIDVPDQKKADAIKDYVQERLKKHGIVMPVRYREDSGKCLLAFIVHSEEMFKQAVKVEGGIIEFLATGQQFIAAGTHQDGQRYKWDWHGVEEFPVVKEKAILKIWKSVCNKFGIEDATKIGAARKRDRNAAVVPDATMDFLEKNSLVLSYGSEGQANIECPFKDAHTTEGNESSTCYFPKGSRGYAQGHFKCSHAHCAARKDVDFEEALGVLDGHFEAIELLPGEAALQLPSGLVRDKTGKIEAMLHNLDLALQDARMSSVRIGFDEFMGSDRIARMRKDGSIEPWRPVKDTDYTRLRRILERRGFKPIRKEMMIDALKLEADKMRFDSAKVWLDNLPKWDGVKRVERFLSDYLGTKDDAYTRSVSLYLFSALAGRILCPGIKADMALALVGPQGARKSSAIEAIAPWPETFVKVNLAENDNDQVRKILGKIVGELDELKGLNSRDSETIKSFITRSREEWVKKYEERPSVFLRRIVFLASTNNEQFLADETGERRWLPFKVAVGKKIIDVDKILKDKEQLYAEGRILFESGGIRWREAEELARNEHSKFKVVDANLEVVRDWLESDDHESGKPSEQDYLFPIDILQHALGFRPKEIKRGDEMALGKTMKQLGWKKKQKRIKGDNKWVFVKERLIS